MLRRYLSVAKVRTHTKVAPGEATPSTLPMDIALHVFIATWYVIIVVSYSQLKCEDTSRTYTS